MVIGIECVCRMVWLYGCEVGLCERGGEDGGVGLVDDDEQGVERKVRRRVIRQREERRE